MREYLGVEFEDKLLKNCEIKQRDRNETLFGGETKEKPTIKQSSAVTCEEAWIHSWRPCSLSQPLTGEGKEVTSSKHWTRKLICQLGDQPPCSASHTIRLALSTLSSFLQVISYVNGLFSFGSRDGFLCVSFKPSTTYSVCCHCCFHRNTKGGFGGL